MKKYEKPGMELIWLQMYDVITASGELGWEQEGTTPGESLDDFLNGNAKGGF